MWLKYIEMTIAISKASGSAHRRQQCERGSRSIIDCELLSLLRALGAASVNRFRQDVFRSFPGLRHDAAHACSKNGKNRAKRILPTLGRGTLKAKGDAAVRRMSKVKVGQTNARVLSTLQQCCVETDSMRWTSRQHGWCCVECKGCSLKLHPPRAGFIRKTIQQIRSKKLTLIVSLLYGVDRRNQSAQEDISGITLGVYFIDLPFPLFFCEGDSCSVGVRFAH